MVLATVTFAIQFTYDCRQQYLNNLILDHWTFGAIIGHMWLHASIFHIVCNLIFLWVFGRQVCMKIGNANYPFAYLIVGVGAGIVHMIYDGRPSIGASGAIMGILGMHLVFCFRQFSLAGPWIILVWFLLNLSVGILSLFPTAYLAHVGGFFTGLLLANAMIVLEMVNCNDIDIGLLHILHE